MGYSVDLDATHLFADKQLEVAVRALRARRVVSTSVQRTARAIFKPLGSQSEKLPWQEEESIRMGWCLDRNLHGACCRLRTDDRFS